ncbi:MAG TPA: hypothetical protein VHV30_14105 [Polyangiaceae bacterium]|nr:hypothetical protein [Polyangiaceae bacterium]
MARRPTGLVDSTTGSLQTHSNFFTGFRDASFDGNDPFRAGA